jgi:nucleotide-binding universal stress UspA family protein
MSICRIFVPLDGSDLAENALPPAVAFAAAYGAAITLLHGIEKGATGEVHAAHHLTEASEAGAYLDDVQRRFLPAGMPAECHVHASAVRNVPHSIVEHAREGNPDLIVMCAHGPERARDWLTGNIAQQVIREGFTPVLFLRAAASPKPGAQFACRSILLPLDGIPEHEETAVLAEEVARSFKAAIHLVTVVQTIGTLAGEKAATARLLPGTTEAMLDLAEENAGNHLATHLERLKAAGLQATAQVVRGDPAEELARLVMERGDDLIVMGTHGRAGSDAFWNRSTAARVLGRMNVPALLIPVKEAKSK